jgi:hypothetical protein
VKRLASESSMARLFAKTVGLAVMQTIHISPCLAGGCRFIRPRRIMCMYYVVNEGSLLQLIRMTIPCLAK